jgi:ribosomal protein S18 acetylase RimI-like enzyme
VRAEAATLEAALEGGPDGARLLVAETSAGQPGGFVYLEQHIDYFRQTPHAHVAGLAVVAEAEGQGVGRRSWKQQSAGLASKGSACSR